MDMFTQTLQFIFIMSTEVLIKMTVLFYFDYKVYLTLHTNLILAM